MSARRLWTLVGVLLAPAALLPLWVTYYAREDPTLFGFPFFYWFQFLLIIVAVTLTFPAFLLSQRAERLDRVRHGLSPEPDAQPGARPGDGSARDGGR